MKTSSTVDKNVYYTIREFDYNRNDFKSHHLHKHLERRQMTRDCNFRLG